MKTHAPFPDMQNLQRMLNIIGQIVKQDISQASTKDNPEYPGKQKISHALAT
jgi:hypothetical protein